MPNYNNLEYRGDGKTRDGGPALTPGERGAYLPSPALRDAVNAAIILERPLLVTGEPGVGKTVLAFSVAAEIGLGEVLRFHVRSDSQSRDLRYGFDNLARFYDAQVGSKRAEDLEFYKREGPLFQAFRSPSPKVVLIDEIDKAPRDFPNDLLDDLDRMEILIPELHSVSVPASSRPIVIITSNAETQLPDPFLRRCVFHHIDRPTRDELDSILRQRLPDTDAIQHLRSTILDRFLELRELADQGRLERAPSTAELLMWSRILNAGSVIEADLRKPVAELPSLGVLFKSKKALDSLRRVSGRTPK